MHQIPATIQAMQAALKDAATANPVFLTTTEKASTLIELGRITAQVEELRLRVMADSGDVAEETGARDVGTWLVAHEVTDATTARRDLALATALDQHETVRAGLAEGRFSVEHARVIVRVLEDLPDDLSADIVASAEVHLCDLATRHRPQDLRRLGRHLLHTIAPDIADLEDAKAIQRLEEAAEQQATLSITSRGDGTSRIHAIVPDAVGERLRTLLESFAQPRVAALEVDGTPRARHRILADALGQLLETIDPQRLPLHGGDATTVIVTIPLDQLRAELGTAQLGGSHTTGNTGTDTGTGAGTGTEISASEARRLACTAGIIPAVLGGKSQPLDLGRTRRLHTPAQRKALHLRDGHCRAAGCTVPATWCDAHHLVPWSRGGPTSLENSTLLCSHHHHRIHDPKYETTRLPNGDIHFHRRP